MAVTTRTVFAVMGVIILSVGVFFHHRGNEAAGFGLFAVGFLLSAGWAGIGMVQAQQGLSDVPPDTYLSVSVTAGAMAFYFGVRSHRTMFGRS
jgi:hypothetical protein